MFVNWMEKVHLEGKKNKEEETEMIVDSNLPDVRKIEVPDLKQYLIDGYEEIREIKQENEELKEKLEEANKFKQFYNATLVTLNEFKIRDEDNKKSIENLNKRIDTKNEEINQLNDIINTYRIRENEINKKEERLNKTIEEIKIETINNFKSQIIDKIINTKGNISKNRLCDIIQNEEAEE